MQSEFLLKWFENPDYQSGTEFYLKHGNNEAIKFLLQKGPNPFSINQLTKALKSLLPPDAEVPKSVEVAAPSFREIPYWFTNLEKQMVIWMKERDSLRGSLSVRPSQEDRKKSAFRILDLGDLIYDAGLQLRDYRDTGKVPVKQEDLPEYDWMEFSDIALMRYLFNSLKPRLSRSKNIKEKLELLKKELHAIEEEIEKREYATVHIKGN